MTDTQMEKGEASHPTASVSECPAAGPRAVPELCCGHQRRFGGERGSGSTTNFLFTRRKFRAVLYIMQIPHPFTLETNHITTKNNSTEIYVKIGIEDCRFVRTFLQKLIHSHLMPMPFFFKDEKHPYLERLH